MAGQAHWPGRTTEQEQRQSLEIECAAAKKGLAEKHSCLEEAQEALVRAQNDLRRARQAEAVAVSEHETVLQSLVLAEQGRSEKAEEAAHMEQTVAAKAQRIRELSNAASIAM